jgi:hypothetical protein
LPQALPGPFTKEDGEVVIDLRTSTLAIHHKPQG